MVLKLYTRPVQKVEFETRELNGLQLSFGEFWWEGSHSEGQIRLPMQVGLEVEEVNFIMVDAYSPYTAIIARPQLHALRAVSFTLHQKVKYPSGGCIEEIMGSQSTARQCLVAAILHQPETESSASTGRDL